MMHFLDAFSSYLLLEKGLSKASIDAYINDVKKLFSFFDLQNIKKPIAAITLEDLQQLMAYLNDLGLTTSSQARIISGLKAYFEFLSIEDLVEDDPTQLLSAPKLGKYLPSFLTHQEVEKIMAQIDHSKPEGIRNRAMIETLYACGLRVSELVNLRMSYMYLDAQYIRVIGKGNKERIIPIGETAIKHIRFYISNRNQMSNIKKEAEDICFLNRRGNKLSRNMVFMIIKDLVRQTDIQKNVSPHTFRHTFATHLIEGGANLRVVQDLLGHKSIITTEIYTHLDMGYLRETIQMFHPRFKK